MEEFRQINFDAFNGERRVYRIMSEKCGGLKSEKVFKNIIISLP